MNYKARAFFLFFEYYSISNTNQPTKKKNKYGLTPSFSIFSWSTIYQLKMLVMLTTHRQKFEFSITKYFLHRFFFILAMFTQF